MATEITSANVKKEVEESTKPVILDIFASWCGPCQQMMPIIDELEKELGEKYKFAKLNVDESQDLAAKYGVSSVPTFLFIKDNKELHRASGYMSKDDFLTQIGVAFGN